MSEQDHKFSSMLGLVSTMADEIHELKYKAVVPVNQHQHQQNETYNNYEDDDEEVGLKKHSLGGKPINLIHVSDDEETSSESEGETDAEDSEADDDESDAEDSEVDDDESVSETDDLEDNINLDINLDNDINILDLEDMSNDITEEADEIDKTNDELVDLGDVKESTDVAVNDIKSIHLAEPINIHLDELSPVEITNDLKTISISMTDIGMNINDFGDDSNKHKSVDYKKMSLNKLRDVVVEKGIIPDASKLKKNELLKLLGEE